MDRFINLSPHKIARAKYSANYDQWYIRNVQGVVTLVSDEEFERIKRTEESEGCFYSAASYSLKEVKIFGDGANEFVLDYYEIEKITSSFLNKIIIRDVDAEFEPIHYI